jgi:hypothetical protein
MYGENTIRLGKRSTWSRMPETINHVDNDLDKVNAKRKDFEMECVVGMCEDLGFEYSWKVLNSIPGGVTYSM